MNTCDGLGGAFTGFLALGSFIGDDDVDVGVLTGAGGQQVNLSACMDVAG